MITITIGQDVRQLSSPSDIEESWINQQINRRRASGQSVCTRVRIQEAGLDLSLATPGCGGSGGGRPPTHEEQRIIELWRERHLTQSEYTGGDLIAFLRQLFRLVD